MNFIIILSVLFIHWIADFVLQTDWQAKNKSSNWNALIHHTGVYSFVWFLCSPLLIAYLCPGHDLKWLVMAALVFALGTFILHTATDAITSRINKRLYEKGKTHEFFVSIGFDQILHYAQLFAFLFLFQTKCIV